MVQWIGIYNKQFVIISEFKDTYINICSLKSKYYWIIAKKALKYLLTKFFQRVR